MPCGIPCRAWARTPPAREPALTGFRARLALVALAAFAVRVAYALTIAPDANADVPFGDRFFFVEGARLLAAGHGFVHPFVWQAAHVDAPSAGHPPLWIAALAPLAKLGLLTLDSARIAGAAAGAGAVAAVGLVGRRLAGARAGLLAAASAALYPAWIVGDTSGMSEALYVLLVGLAVLATLAARADGRRGSAALAGAAIGLAALTRTEGLALVAFVAWPALWPRRWALPLIATACAALVVAPWTVRNALSLQRFVAVSTNEATVLAGANCRAAYHGRDTGSWRPDCLARATGRIDLARYDEGVLADRWRRAGLAYARDHLGRLPAVAAMRALRTWRLWQPLREGRLSEGQNATVSKVGALTFLVLLAPAGLLGAWLARRRRRRGPALLLAALAAMVTLTSAAGWGAPRFLRPAELALLVCAGAGAATLRGARGRLPPVGRGGTRP